MTAQAGMATSRSIRRRRPLLAAAVLLLTVAVVARAQKPDLFDAPAPPSPPSALAEQKPVAPPTPPASTLPTEAAPAPSDAPAPETPAVPAVDVPPAPPAPPVPPVPSPPTPPVAPAPTQGEAAAAAVDSLALANTLGSHMVLQQAPLAACLYGTGAPLAVVQVSIEGNALASAQTMVDPLGNWVACLPPHKAGGPHTITVAGSGGKRTLEDVWFGEVWLCSGQSNMQMSLRQVLNATKELQASVALPKNAPIRVLSLRLNTSAEPLNDVEEALLPWSVASPETLGGPVWKYFSGACWFYGRHLAEGLNVPIGLIQAAYGSTELKAWSPPEALAACPPTPDEWAPTPVDGLEPEEQQPPPEVAAGTGTGAATDPAVPSAAPAVPAVVTTTPPSPPPPPPPSQPAATTAAPAAPSAPTTPTAAAAGNGNLRRRVAAAAPAPTAAEGPEPEAEPPGLEPKRPGKPRAWQTAWHPEPATCFNALIHPLRLMALRGVVWDQGEQDVHHAAEDYACLLPEFIKGWRRAFPYANALGPMPVGVFQLQGYNDDYMDITNNGTEVGRIRLAQSEGARAVPQVFLAVGYDLNDDASPYGPVHFRDKQDVGRRLAQSALANVYGKWGPLPWGPTVKEVVPTWSSDALDADALLLTVRVEYADVGDGLVDSGVNIFELAADADAEDYEEEVLESTGVTLAGPATAVVAFRVPKAHALAQADAAPVLRYAYRNRPCPERMAETPYVGAWCGLYSSEEQPALPFVRELQ